MPAPDYYCTQVELERAISAAKLRELFPETGGTGTDTTRVGDVLRDSTGEVRSYLQVALSLNSIDQKWDTWEENDKAEIRRLTKQVAIYYAHLYGERAEDIPDIVQRNVDTAREQLKATAERLKSVGAHEAPATSRQYSFVAPRQVGESHPEGPRRNFSRGGGWC